MKKLIATASVFATSLFISASAFAQEAVNPCPGDGSSGETNFSGLCNLTLVNSLPRIITIVMIVAIVLALAFLIYGGIRWILSGGDKTKVETARGTIIAAIVGLVIIFLSWFILNIVLQFFTGQALQDLTLPSL